MNEDEFPVIKTRSATTSRNRPRTRRRWRPTALTIAIETTIFTAYTLFIACWILFSIAFPFFHIFLIINELLLAVAAISQLLSSRSRQHRLPALVAVLLLASQVVTVVAFALALMTGAEGLMFQALGIGVGSIAIRMFALGPLLIISSSLTRLVAGSDSNTAK